MLKLFTVQGWKTYEFQGSGFMSEYNLNFFKTTWSPDLELGHKNVPIPTPIVEHGSPRNKPNRWMDYATGVA